MHGHRFVRGFTHTCEAERVGGVWVMRDALRTSGNDRREEWMACGMNPKTVDGIVRKHARGHYSVCAFLGVDEPDCQDAFRVLGYRLGHTEPLMVHGLRRIQRAKSPTTIRRIATTELADRLARTARSRMIFHEHLVPNPPMRAYVALIKDEIVGWCRSVVVGHATYCAFVHVKEPFRRRGIAKALMCKMLRDDRESGATMAVLLASHTGAKLYTAVGYEQLGTLLLFTRERS